MGLRAAEDAAGLPGEARATIRTRHGSRFILRRAAPLARHSKPGGSQAPRDSSPSQQPGTPRRRLGLSSPANPPAETAPYAAHQKLETQSPREERRMIPGQFTTQLGAA